jgi:hypothetical protein
MELVFEGRIRENSLLFVWLACFGTSVDMALRGVPI